MMLRKLWTAFGFLVLSPAALYATQTHFVQVVTPAQTLTAVQATTSSPLAGAPFTLMVSISAPNGAPVSAGTVTLTDNGSPLGSASIVNGSASVSETLPTSGAHQINACYQGDANYQASCSAAMIMSVQGTFMLSATTATSVVSASTSFLDQLQIIPAAGYSGTVTFTCQAPAIYTCTVLPSSVSVAGNGAAQTVQVSINAVTPAWAKSALLLPLLGLVGWKRRQKKLRYIPCVLALFCTLGLICLSGCGSEVATYSMTPGTYNIVVTGTSGKVTQSVTYLITVPSA